MKFEKHIFHSIDVSPGYVNCLTCKNIRQAIGIHANRTQKNFTSFVKEEETNNEV